MNKNIKLLIENIFQREGARELLKRSKAEELDAQIRKMYLYHPTTREELIDNIIECFENESDINYNIDVSGIDDFTNVFSSYYTFNPSKLIGYIKDKDITSIDISNWNINPKAKIDEMFYASPLKEVILPNNLQKIAKSMFCYSSITTINIPKTVIKIYESAFSYTRKLLEVNIPEGVKDISSSSFSYSAIDSITIPKSLTKIGKNVFENCKNLRRLVWNAKKCKLYDSITYNHTAPLYNMNIEELIIGDEVVYLHDFFCTHCRKLTHIIIPNSVTSIGEHVFEKCTELTKLRISNSLKTIGYKAFSNCIKLKSITIPGSVVSIDTDAFDNCDNINKIIVDESNTVYDSRDNCNAIIETASNTLIMGCKKTFIPDSVVSIGESAFRECTGLKSINIPNSVISIGNLAFYSCKNLKSVIIPETVTYIGINAFTNCEGLTNLTILNTNMKIEYPFFYKCKKLKYVYVDDVVNFKPEQFFHTNVKIKPVKSKTINENIFQREGARELLKRSKAEELDNQIRKMYLYRPTTKYELIDNVLECLENETNLNLIDVSEITDFEKLFNRYYKIGDYIQQQNITSIDISGWYIRSDANVKNMFESSTLEEIVLPNNLQKIDNKMFYESSLTRVTIPNSVTSIGDEVFADCSGLTSITIPNSVTSIGDMAFSGCSGLTSIVVESGNTIYDSRDECNAIIETTSNTLIAGCMNTIIPDSVTSIGDYAFWYCSGLTSVDIPTSVTEIGYFAFYGCSGLTSVIIPNSVETIDLMAFPDSPNLTIYVNNVAEFKRKFKNYRKFCKAKQIKPIRNKPINENIFQREGARELLKKSKYEEILDQLSHMPLPYNANIKEVLFNLFGVGKPAGYTLIESNPDKYQYEQYIRYTKTMYDDAYAKKIIPYFEDGVTIDINSTLWYNYDNVYVQLFVLQYVQKKCIELRSNKNLDTLWYDMFEMQINDLYELYKINEYNDRVKDDIKKYIIKIKNIYLSYPFIIDYPFAMVMYISKDNGLYYIISINHKDLDNTKQRYIHTISFTGTENYANILLRKSTNSKQIDEQNKINKKIKKKFISFIGENTQHYFQYKYLKNAPIYFDDENMPYMKSVVINEYNMDMHIQYYGISLYSDKPTQDGFTMYMTNDGTLYIQMKKINYHEYIFNIELTDYGKQVFKDYLRI